MDIEKLKDCASKDTRQTDTIPRSEWMEMCVEFYCRAPSETAMWDDYDTRMGVKDDVWRGIAERENVGLDDFFAFLVCRHPLIDEAFGRKKQRSSWYRWLTREVGHEPNLGKAEAINNYAKCLKEPGPSCLEPNEDHAMAGDDYIYYGHGP